MLPPATSVVVGATIEKRFPGYGVHRGTVAEIDGGKVLVHWATDERTTLSLKEATKRVVAIPSEDDDDDQSVTSAAFGIESSATSFTAPRHVRRRAIGAACAQGARPRAALRSSPRQAPPRGGRRHAVDARPPPAPHYQLCGGPRLRALIGRLGS